MDSSVDILCITSAFLCINQPNGTPFNDRSVHLSKNPRPNGTPFGCRILCFIKEKSEYLQGFADLSELSFALAFSGNDRTVHLSLLYFWPRIQ